MLLENEKTQKTLAFQMFGKRYCDLTKDELKQYRNARKKEQRQKTNNSYDKEYHENNKEYFREYHKQYYKNKKGE